MLEVTCWLLIQFTCSGTILLVTCAATHLWCSEPTLQVDTQQLTCSSTEEPEDKRSVQVTSDGERLHFALTLDLAAGSDDYLLFHRVTII